MMVYEYFPSFHHSVDLMPVTWTDFYQCLIKEIIKKSEWFTIIRKIFTKHEEEKDLMPYFTDAYFFIDMISYLNILGLRPIVSGIILLMINIFVKIKILRCKVYGDLREIPILSGLDVLLFLTKKKICIEYEIDSYLKW
jgi:hypothetical protein